MAVAVSPAPLARIRELFDYYRLLKRRAPLPKPHACLMTQARELHAAGYHAAAVITARCAIESQLRGTIAALDSGWRNVPPRVSINQLAAHLFTAKVIDNELRGRIRNWADKAGAAAHGRFNGGRERSANLVAQATRISRAIAVKGGGA